MKKQHFFSQNGSHHQGLHSPWSSLLPVYITKEAEVYYLAS